MDPGHVVEILTATLDPIHQETAGKKLDEVSQMIEKLDFLYYLDVVRTTMTYARVICVYSLLLSLYVSISGVLDDEK